MAVEHRVKESRKRHTGRCMIKKGERISDGNFAGQVESVTFVKSVKVNAERCRILYIHKLIRLLNIIK
ncbi:hypothetical protein B5F34_02910 [Mediterranea sp. An20]|nr:hypothetical protein B5F34_02910 [Mediterranea sp. An20]